MMDEICHVTRMSDFSHNLFIKIFNLKKSNLFAYPDLCDSGMR